VSETTEQFYRRKERERIIKLLEDPANHRNDVDPDWYAGITDAIDLIKGDNK
jgi:hypothetical protein